MANIPQRMPITRMIQHEESVRGTLAEVIAHFTATEPRGEIVIILSGKED